MTQNHLAVHIKGHGPVIFCYRLCVPCPQIPTMEPQLPMQLCVEIKKVMCKLARGRVGSNPTNDNYKKGYEKGPRTGHATRGVAGDWLTPGSPGGASAPQASTPGSPGQHTWLPRPAPWLPGPASRLLGPAPQLPGPAPWLQTVRKQIPVVSQCCVSGSDPKEGKQHTEHTWRLQSQHTHGAMRGS